MAAEAEVEAKTSAAGQRPKRRAAPEVALAESHTQSYALVSAQQLRSLIPPQALPPVKMLFGSKQGVATPF